LLSSGFLKKALSNEEPPDPMPKNYLFPTALAIIFTLQPITGDGPKSPRPFPQKHVISHRNLATVSRSRRLSCLRQGERPLVIWPSAIIAGSKLSRHFSRHRFAMASLSL
jgi:hypothetical protein